MPFSIVIVLLSTKTNQTAEAVGRLQFFSHRRQLSPQLLNLLLLYDIAAVN
ncbi:hypothetical protein [Spirosoma linguale]|uniref:hypothetical protein n=1 Tax=Spirosoma linguale TaxID=108 RepID=UPI003CC7DA38